MRTTLACHHLPDAEEAPQATSRSTLDHGRSPDLPPSHIHVVRPAAAFGRHPVDVLVGVLDVACFAVHAVLGVDWVAHADGGRILNPFVDAGRAITLRRSGVD